jgi:hypothetical protein
MMSFLADVRHSVQTLRKPSVLSAVAILSLALGIGATHCHLNAASDTDMHMALVEGVGDAEKASVVIEYTPRFLKAHPNCGNRAKESRLGRSWAAWSDSSTPGRYRTHDGRGRPTSGRWFRQLTDSLCGITLLWVRRLMDGRDVHQRIEADLNEA